jgi:hypothetical protein
VRGVGGRFETSTVEARLCVCDTCLHILRQSPSVRTARLPPHADGYAGSRQYSPRGAIPRREVVTSPVDTVRFSEFRRCNSYIATIITGQRPMAVQGFPEPLVDERKQALVRTEVR